MKLDTRRPIIVLLGAWNPAVFSPQWAATHLYDIQEGAEITLSIFNMQPENKTITYIQDNIGYYADNTRFEIYANSFSNDHLAKVAQISQRLLEKLPHTPLGDFGINYHFIESDPSSSLLDKLTSNDQIESRFRILAQEFMARILYKNNCQLNFKRVSTDKHVIFDFNYHHSVQAKKDFEQITADYLHLLLNESATHVKELYDVQDYEEVHHDFARPSEPRET